MRQALIFLTICFLHMEWASAQNVVSDEFSLGYNGLSSQTLNFTGETELTGVTGELDSKLHEARLYLKLFVGTDQYKHNSWGSIDEYTLTCRIQVFNTSAQVEATEICTLKISSLKPEMWYHMEVTHIEGLSHIEVDQVSGDNIPTSASSLEQYVRDNLKFEGVLEARLATDVRLNGTLASAPAPQAVSVAGNSRIANLSWTCDEKYPNYEIQVLKLENINAALASGQQITAMLEWNNALKVYTESPAKTFATTLTGGSGFYAWRVRPIGDFYHGGIADSRNYGPWSTGSLPSFSMVTLSASNVATGYIYLNDPDEDVNWQLSRAFTEGGRAHESITYAGGLMHTKQTQSRIGSSNDVVMSQTIQDYSGRDALTTLPVPVESINGLSGYKEKLAMANGGLYDASDFDVPGTNMYDPTQITGGAYGYYSGQNTTEEYVPDAQGYPFSRTIFFNDGGNAPREVATPGEAHALTTAQGDKGHTTRYYYSPATEDELLRLFGDQAPAATSVYKTVTVDPNNTTTVSYMSKEGKVIATSLALNPNDNLATPDNVAPFDIVNEATSNVETMNGFVSSRRVAFDGTTDFHLEYTYNCEGPSSDCGGEVDCGYSVKFRILDLQTGDLYETGNMSMSSSNCINGLGQISITSSDAVWTRYNAAGTYVSGPMSLSNLEAGNYIFEKYAFTGTSLGALMAAGASNANGLYAPLVEMMEAKLAEAVANESMDGFYDYMNNFANALSAAKSVNTPQAYAGLAATYSPFFDDWGQDYSEFGELTFTVPNYGSTEEVSLEMSSGSCCGTINVPAGYSPQFVCPETFSPGMEELDFEGYAFDRLSPMGIVDSDLYGYEGLIGGYTKGVFNDMIYKMLTDKDLCQEGYKCEDLWKCWIAAVSAYEDILKQGLLDDGQDDMNPMESIHDERGQNTTQDGKGSDTEKEVNDGTEENADAGPIMRWLANRAMGKRLNDEYGNETDGTEEIYTYNIAAEFLNCAGYQFVEILHPDNMPSDPDDADYQAYRSGSFDVFEGPKYPYILDPLYAYKYYTYDAWQDAEAGGYIPRFIEAEVLYCYDPARFPCDNICKPIVCSGNHDSWDCATTLEFYDLIKNIRKPKTEDYLKLDIDWECSLFGYYTEGIDAFKKIADIRDDAISACGSKRTDIINDLKLAFLENCYTIGGCSGPGVITEQEIASIADKIIEQCKAEVHAMVPESYDGTYLFQEYICSDWPKTIDNGCQIYVDGGCEDYDYCSLELLPPAYLKKLQFLKHGKVQVSRDFSIGVVMENGTTYYSACTTPPTAPSASSGWEGSVQAGFALPCGTLDETEKAAKIYIPAQAAIVLPN